MNLRENSSKWLFVGLGLLLGLFHLVLWHYSNRIFDLVMREKGGLFLEALASSADQTLQASHFLEERIVDRLKAVSREVLSAPPGSLSQSGLESLARSNDVRGIYIYDATGKVVISSDPALMGSQLPESFECHEILHGNRNEHVFGFSKGIFCEADAFGYAVRMSGNRLLRILTGVEFVLGFEQSVGLTALIKRFRKHPGVRFLDLIDLKGNSLLPVEERMTGTPGMVTVTQALNLHGMPVGSFQLSLDDPGVDSLRGTTFGAILCSAIFSLLVLGFLFRRIAREREIGEKQVQIEDSHKRIEGLGKIVAAVAHEVRNPLNTLSLGLNALREDFRGKPGEDSIQGHLKILNTAVSQANEMTKNLLQTSRPILAAAREFPLTEWIEGIRSTFASAFRGVNLQINPGGLVSLKTDPELLKRVIWNLLLNAAQAGAEKINLWFCPEPSGLAIHIEDNGPGIPTEVLSNLFIPGNTGRSDGFGLGLYNCHRMTYSLGGRIEVKTGTQGTCFSLYLPNEGKDASS